MQPLKDSDRRALWILTIVSLVALAGGIFLATRTKMDAGRPADGQMWKLVLGISIAAIAGIVFITVVVVLISYSQPRSSGRSGIWSPYEALSGGRITREFYLTIRRRELLVMGIVVVSMAVMLVFWHTKFAILLAAGLILGAVGALALHNYGKAAMFILAGSAGIIAGVVNAAAAGPAKEKRYDYYVNGVKVAERTKSSSNVPGYFLGGFLLVTVLVVVISFVISYICSLKKVATK